MHTYVYVSMTAEKKDSNEDKIDQTTLLQKYTSLHEQIILRVEP